MATRCPSRRRACLAEPLRPVGVVRSPTTRTSVWSNVTVRRSRRPRAPAPVCGAGGTRSAKGSTRRVGGRACAAATADHRHPELGDGIRRWNSVHCSGRGRSAWPRHHRRQSGMAQAGYRGDGWAVSRRSGSNISLGPVAQLSPTRSTPMASRRRGRHRSPSRSIVGSIDGHLDLEGDGRSGPPWPAGRR